MEKTEPSLLSICLLLLEVRSNITGVPAAVPSGSSAELRRYEQQGCQASVFRKQCVGEANSVGNSGGEGGGDVVVGEEVCLVLGRSSFH